MVTSGFLATWRKQIFRKLVEIIFRSMHYCCSSERAFAGEPESTQYLFLPRGGRAYLDQGELLQAIRKKMIKEGKTF